jgi:hypothetical protein
MTTVERRSKLVLFTLAASLSLAAGGESFVNFSSTQYHYSVTYPSSWHTHDPAPKYLDICNFPWEHRVHGVIIPPHGATITVLGAPSEISTVQDWVTYDTRFSGPVVRDRMLQVLRPLPGGCATLREVVADDDVGPGVYQRATDIYCDTSVGLFVVRLGYWKVDSDEPRYQAVALEIARSLRTGEGRE